MKNVATYNLNRYTNRINSQRIYTLDWLYKTMCNFIYITTIGKVAEHERVCANAGHKMHSDKFIDSQWTPVQ